jgi:hypothetical protein
MRIRAAGCECREKVCSFLKKRTKKLLDFGARDPASVSANEQKSFASFLQKRRSSFPSGELPWTP